MQRKEPFAVGSIYHVFNRGTAKCAICKEDADRWRFLQGLALFNDEQSTASILWRLEHNKMRITMNVIKEYLMGAGKERTPLVRVMAYCIMGNHYHLLLEELQEGGITKFMRKLGTGYAKYFNNKYERVGVLFQSRFKSILVDNEHYLQYLLVYINVLNPADFVEPHWKENGIQGVGKILEFAEKYPWSSHQDYLGKRGSLILDRGVLGDMVPTPENYAALVRSVLDGKRYLVIEHLTLE